MRLGRTVGAVLLCGAAVAGVSAGSIAVMGGPVPAAAVQQAQGHHQGAGHSHRSHPIVRRAVWHVMPHRIMPHPYLFHRPFIMRRLFRSGNRGG